MSEYQDVLREHEFDGIREFDNRLPNWWLWSFYVACIFSVLYWVHYHVLGTGHLPDAEFRAQMAEWEARQAAVPVTDESLAAMSGDSKVVAEGRSHFMVNCVACHAQDGGAVMSGVELAGPNLTDAYWLHGGKPTQIYNTILNGVVEKGMLAWGTILGPAKCQELAAFVLTLKNTDVEGGKKPQGELER